MTSVMQRYYQSRRLYRHHMMGGQLDSPKIR